MIQDLVNFLRARLDEDTALAELQWPGPWHLNNEHDAVLGQDDITIVETVVCSSNQARNTARYVVRYQPARVLAEVDAKRRIIAAHPWRREPDWPSGRQCRQCAVEWPCNTLRLLTLPYADRPGYWPEWAPDA